MSVKKSNVISSGRGITFYSFIFLTTLLFITSSVTTHASIYAPGQTLEPDCYPGTSNCGVDPALGLTLATINSLLNSATSTNIGGASGLTVLQNGNVGIGTSNPQFALDVIGNIRANNINKKGLITYTEFPGTIMPSDWTNSGGFTVNGGLNMVGTGGTDKVAHWNYPSNMENSQISMEVVLNNVSSEVVLAKLEQTQGALHGILASLDGVNNRLVFYTRWDDSSALTVATTKVIPFTLVSGNKYVLTLNKYTTGNYKLTLYDQKTSSTTFMTLTNQDSLVGSADGYPGVMFLGGNVTVNNFSFSTSNPEKPKLIMLGDSITEWGGLSTRYATLISNALNGDAIIAAAGQDTTNTIIQRLNVDLDTFSPEYVLVLAGTNVYIDTTTTIDQLQMIATRITANGAVPIFGTLPPRTVANSDHITINNWIRSSGYKYIDFNTALALGNDPSALGDPNLISSDQIHPTSAGFLAMYNQSLADAPYLFERNQLRVIGSGTSSTIPFWSNNFTLATSSIFIDTSTKYVGIGTSTPSSILNLSGLNSTNLTIDSTISNNSTGAGIVLRNYSDTANYRGSGMFMFDNTAQNEWFIGRPYGKLTDMFMIGRGGSISSHDYSGTLAQTSNSFFTIDNSGKVGIGTSSPSSKLNVFGSNETTLTIESNVTTGNMGADILLKNNPDAPNWRGSGIFMFDSAAQNEWFAGRPYSGDKYVIGRKNSIASHDSSTGISTNALFTISSVGSVGIGTTTPAYTFHVEKVATGTIAYFKSGSNTCSLDPANVGGLSCSSDERLKTNIESLTSSTTLDKIIALRPVTYNWKTDSENSSSTKYTGFIAQEVLPLFPDLISTDTGGNYQLSYSGFIPYIISAIQDLNSKIKEWVGDKITASLGIFQKVQINELCVDDVCVTKDQLKQILLNAGGTVTNSVQVSDPIISQDLTATSTDDVIASSTDLTIATSTDPIIEPEATTTAPVDTVTPPDVTLPPPVDEVVIPPTIPDETLTTSNPSNI